MNYNLSLQIVEINFEMNRKWHTQSTKHPLSWLYGGLPLTISSKIIPKAYMFRWTSRLRPSKYFGRIQTAPSLLMLPELFSDLERTVFQHSKSTNCKRSLEYLVRIFKTRGIYFFFQYTQHASLSTYSYGFVEVLGDKL